MERYPIEYTKKTPFTSLKVGDVIEPTWLWEPRLKVIAIDKENILFSGGVVRSFAQWKNERVDVVKIRMSKTPEWFGK